MDKDIKIVFKNGSMRDVEVYIGDELQQFITNIDVLLHDNDTQGNNDHVLITKYNIDKNQDDTLVGWKESFREKPNVVTLDSVTVTGLAQSLGKEFDSPRNKQFVEQANKVVADSFLGNKNNGR